MSLFEAKPNIRHPQAPTEDQQSVEALAADAADPALDVRVRVRRPDRRPDDPHAFAGEDRIERRRELAVSIVNQEAHRAVAIVEVHQQVARLLQHPGRVGVTRAGDVLDTAAADREKDEHVQTAKPDRVDGQKVTREDRVAVLAQNVRQLVRSRCGAGGMPASASTLRTRVADTLMPSMRSSPPIRT
jgi:hypothetical protein